jgi:hypothetical protein
MNNTELFNFSFNQLEEIKNFTKIYNISVEHIIENFLKSESNSLNISNKKANTQKLMDYILSLKYPTYFHLLQSAKKIEKELLKLNVKFDYHPLFETSDYKLIFMNNSKITEHEKIQILKKIQPELIKFEEMLKNANIP